MLKYILLFLYFSTNLYSQSLIQQKKHPRVKNAYSLRYDSIQKLFKDNNLNFPPENLFLQAFKLNDTLELWAKNNNQKQYKLLRSYQICTRCGEVGPKRKEGDLQVPEGCYFINHLNPNSNFLLSLGINYPNASDRIHSDKNHPGNAIYIHGNCVSLGCLPLTDPIIQELYLICLENQLNFDTKIPVYIFPIRFNSFEYVQLKIEPILNPKLIQFWQTLEPIYNYFLKQSQLPNLILNKEGYYQINKS